MCPIIYIVLLVIYICIYIPHLLVSYVLVYSYYVLD